MTLVGRRRMTSAVTETRPAMLAALGAPHAAESGGDKNLPARPSVVSVTPPGQSGLFKTVMVVPCTMPWGPMYMYEPAVICRIAHAKGIHALPIVGWL